MHEIVPPAGAITGAACTSLCADSDASHLYTADTRGYITMWSVASFIENYESARRAGGDALAKMKNSIEMSVCWKAHTSKIVSMDFVGANETLISASSDESVRYLV